MIGKENDKEIHQQSEEEIRHFSMLGALSLPLKKDLRVRQENLYKIFKELSEEFPDKFPGLCFDNLGEIPYSKDLESDLSHFGSFGMLEWVGPRYRVISPEISQAIRQVLVKTCGKESLKEFAPIAQKFQKLVGKFEKTEKI